MVLINPDRLLPKDKKALGFAREIYKQVKDLPIISPHGHCDPGWFVNNHRFPNPTELFIIPDHYIFRMLISQGFSLNDLGILSAVSK